MIQTKERIKREIKKMQKYQATIKNDVIEERLVYCMSEILRWAVEDTVSWGTPLSQATGNAKILKGQLNITTSSE